MLFSFDKKIDKYSGILIEASEFYAGILLPKNISKKVWLDFEVDSSIPYDAQVFFDCPYLDDEGSEEYKDGYLPFTISFKRFGKNSIETHLKTLAHEMVHVKQYASGELSKKMALTPRGRIKSATFWQGKEFKTKKNEDAYWDCPWEIEAYGREDGLYRRFRGLY